MLQTANNVDCCYKLPTALAVHAFDKWTTSTSRKKKWMLFLFFFHLLSFPDPHSLGPDVDNGGEGQKTDGELQLRSRDPYKYKYIINDQLFLATIFLLQLHSNTTQLARHPSSFLAVWHDLHLFCNFLAPSIHCCWSPNHVTCLSKLWRVCVNVVTCTGCFFSLFRPNFSTKKKNVVQPTRIFVHREFHGTESRIGCQSFFILVLKIGRNS